MVVMKANLKMIKVMEKEYIIIKMETYMKENGKTVKRKEGEFIIIFL